MQFRCSLGSPIVVHDISEDTEILAWYENIVDMLTIISLVEFLLKGTDTRWYDGGPVFLAPYKIL